MLQGYNLQREEEVRKFWKENKIMEKARRKNVNAEKKFYFMDGPPYATGHIHMGTALNKILKDIAMRYYRLKGYDVFDRPGYDTHGLPIEHKVEQLLGFKSKKDIENYGVDKFVAECRKFATQYIGVMNREFENLGVWMDWDNPYLTLTNEYIEAIWYSFKKAEEKGLLYLGLYPVHVCPRCETALAYNEIEYTKLEDESIYVKFPSAELENTYFLIWTTTPWTLPGNTGIMVHPEYEYVFAKLSNGETWIIAKELLPKFAQVLEFGYVEEKVVKGKELEGMRYRNPLSKYLNIPEEKVKDGYRVILSKQYVHLEEGTGLVHCAPGHGKEDYDAGTKAGLPLVTPVAINGILTQEAGKYSGLKARESADKQIVEDLQKDGFLVYKHPVKHDYPICWRCKTPLLMVAMPQWFFKVTSIRERLLKHNEEVKWVPKWMKDRMKNWLEQLGDWPISRNRYWGAPLPIWICTKCKKRKVVGSIKELKENAINMPQNLDLHKPQIDEIKLKCSCGGEMERVKEVLDVWFDSGVSSWAALGFPQTTELMDKYWPADLNIEGSDQFRGWWNSQLICSEICFGKKPFKAIVVHGLVLALSKKKLGLKEKMSKSKGNVVTPQEVIEKYNRDYLRYFMAANSKGLDLAFDWSYFENLRKYFVVFWNSFNFFKLYLDIKLNNTIAKELLENAKIEDLWILSELNSLLKRANNYYKEYLFYKVTADVEEFVIRKLSHIYIKLIRDRVAQEKILLQQICGYIAFKLLQILSPIIPHTTEYLYQQLKSKDMPESIHLCNIDDADETLIDQDLERDMAKAIEFIKDVLAIRDSRKLKLRWPLKKLYVADPKMERFANVLKKMCNVKEVSFNEPKEKDGLAKGELAIWLNVTADEELKDEWELRELIRRIQALRKKKGYNPLDKIDIELFSDDVEFLKKFKGIIEEETNSNVKIEKCEGEKLKLLKREFIVNV
ncbi:MAG: isoleucine--tRNA ligase [Candidatus Iainarchaeum archaeon]|uniref:Isoleucine--tRNA ligase n=1 Tax=Candidatus Iainarchaeum sp. TaxID=3101447 RepID=A0A497JJ17_9ARCH|nr:MAG: isoleucine--tRNA ligase [Candidatus Diapherotrites archaeon]